MELFFLYIMYFILYFASNYLFILFTLCCYFKLYKVFFFLLFLEIYFENETSRETEKQSNFYLFYCVNTVYI